MRARATKCESAGGRRLVYKQRAKGRALGQLARNVRAAASTAWVGQLKTHPCRLTCVEGPAPPPPLWLVPGAAADGVVSAPAPFSRRLVPQRCWPAVGGVGEQAGGEWRASADASVLRQSAGSTSFKEASMSTCTAAGRWDAELYPHWRVASPAPPPGSPDCEPVCNAMMWFLARTCCVCVCVCVGVQQRGRRMGWRTGSARRRRWFRTACRRP